MLLIEPSGIEIGIAGSGGSSGSVLLIEPSGIEIV